MKEGYLYKKIDSKTTECLTCSHFCKIKEGEIGICGIRQDIEGKLYLLAYGRAAALNIDPIEKKPLYHFLPGSFAYSFGTLGCNFRCANCQNYDISQMYGLKKKEGLKNVWVSNGYMSNQTLDLIIPYLDAINVDIKSFDDEFYKTICGARLQPVLENCKRLVKEKVWLEITTLIIPTLSDDENMLRQIARFIKNELGDFVPWHVSAFSGLISWKLQDLPDTPFEKVKRAHQIGREEGLKNVYMGNV